MIKPEYGWVNIKERYMQYRIKNFLKGTYLNIRKILLIPFLFLRRLLSVNDKEIGNILFLRHDRIGDMVLSTPAFKALKRNYPNARITVLASERNQEIIQNNPNVDEIIIYGGLYRFVKEIRNKWFDLAIDPFNTYEFKQAFLSYLSGARYRIGFEDAGREIFFNIKGPGLYPVKHLVEHMLELVSYLGCDVSGCEPEIFITDEEREWALRFLLDKKIDLDKPTIAIHPGGYYETQRWHPERFGLAAKELVQGLRVNIIVFGDKSEVSILNRIKEICDGIVITSGINIRQLMAILSRCTLFLGNNSGPLHIAAAIGLPTVSIVGPTAFPLWRPYGKNHIVLRKDLECSPCNLADCKEHKCMEMITVDEVIEAVKKQLKEYAHGC